MAPPKQKPGKSKQDYCTPPEFLTALKRKLGITEFSCDLAADSHNHVCPAYYDETVDSLKQTWVFAHQGWGFCNPPYANIRPWVEKAVEEAGKGAYVAMLVPASVGANWWAESVEHYAYVLFLNGRITFVGETTPYPKDCAVLLYTPFTMGGTAVWSWDTQEVVEWTPK